MIELLVERWRWLIMKMMTGVLRNYRVSQDARWGKHAAPGDRCACLGMLSCILTGHPVMSESIRNTRGSGEEQEKILNQYLIKLVISAWGFSIAIHLEFMTAEARKCTWFVFAIRSHTHDFFNHFMLIRWSGCLIW